MAVIDVNAVKGKKTEAKVVDPFDASLVRGTKSKLDPTEDAWEFSAPPPGGMAYKVQLFPQKDKGFIQDQADPKDADSIFYAVNMECRVTEPSEYAGIPVFSTVTTKIGRGKNISTMAGLISRLGYKLPDEAEPLQLFQMLAKILRKEPIGEVVLDWRGSYQDSKEKWHNVFNSMKDFPKNEDGEYEHVVMHRTVDGEKVQIRAQLNIKEWLKKGSIKVSGAEVAAAPKKAAVKESVEEVEEEEVKVLSAPIKKGKAAPVPAAVEEEDDLELVLE